MTGRPRWVAGCLALAMTFVLLAVTQGQEPPDPGLHNDLPYPRGEVPPPSQLPAIRASSVPSLPAQAYLPLVFKDTPSMYGVNLADLGNMELVEQMDFKWIKGYVRWDDCKKEESGTTYDWSHPDNVVNAAEAWGMKVLLRVDHPPSWANGTGGTHPPNNPNDFGDFMYAMASRYRGKVDAYEIWNEPNLNYEWGGQTPSPSGYTALLAACYPRIKTADPSALVVSAGLATTGDGGSGAMGDLHFIRGMYDAGAKPYFDVLGSHPYGGRVSPDATWDSTGLYFYRVKEQHDVMVQKGDGAKPVWATEFGWVVNTSCDLGYHNQMKVSESQQAQYLARAYQKAKAEWPWLQVMFLFNLDFGAVQWYETCDPIRWFSIVYREGEKNQRHGDPIFRPAYDSLRDMPK